MKNNFLTVPLRFLGRIPWTILLPAALLLGLAPFYPEPHLWEKLRLLAAGRLQRPVDILDLLLHGGPLLLVLGKSLAVRFGHDSGHKSG